MRRTLITSALPYANGYIHLGHLAGAYLPADMYARFMRLAGEEVLYVCGSDEHGVAITISAEREKTTPKAIIDKYHTANAEAFKKFGMSFDIYSRTSNELHRETSIDFFEVLLQNKYLEEREEEQFFDAQTNMFLPDRYVEGKCPNCGYDKARGDQCDKCGAYYEQTQLVDPISTVSNTRPQVRRTTHWYLKLGMFQDFLATYIDSNAKEWKDNVLNQARGWLKMGLTDRAITRDLEWGVKIENAKGIDRDKAKGKVLYVWFDAVLGYITATKEWAMAQAAKGNGDKDDWKKWWKDEDTRHIAFIGKDNIVFHTLMLPALEMAYGGFIMPANVPANEFLNLEGNKFSKSRHWSIDLRDFINDFNNDQSVDALRYTLASTLPETKDSDFTWRDYQSRTNNELAAIFGNFVNRTFAFIHKNMGGRVPVLSKDNAHLPEILQQLIQDLGTHKISSPEDIKALYTKSYTNTLSINDFILFVSIWQGMHRIEQCYRKFRMKDVVTETMNLARAANKYFNDEEPWKAMKENLDKCHKTLYICSQLAYSLSIAFAPIIPYTAAKIQLLFGKPFMLGAPNAAKGGENIWKRILQFNIEEGCEIGKPKILFDRVEDDIIEKQIAKLGISSGNTDNKQDTAADKNDSMITIDDFAKIQLKTAKVLEAEAVPKSKKLLKLQVKIGDENRQILAGIAEHYKPEELTGKTVVVVANLKPAKLMGLESQGMVLCASNNEKLFILSPECEIGDNAEVR